MWRSHLLKTRNLKRYRLNILCIVCFVIVVDRVLKILFENILSSHDIVLIDNLLSFSLVRNTGVAFSFFANNKIVLIAVPIIYILAILIFLYNKASRINQSTRIFLSFIVGGGIANLIDRIKDGYVVDYIAVSKFPVFNFADICITVSVILLLVSLFFRPHKKL